MTDAALAAHARKTSTVQGVAAFALAFAALNLAAPNAFLAAMCLAVLAIGFALLWRPGEAPVLLFVFLYQWLQTGISVFHANLTGAPMVEYAAFGGDMPMAITLCLAGLLALAAGMRIGAGARDPATLRQARVTVLSQPISRWFALYVQAAAVSFALLWVAIYAPGFYQPLLAVASLKWAFFFMLAYAAFVRGVGLNVYLVVAFLYELAVGLGGYFSEFKTVMFFTLLAAVMAGVRLRPRVLLAIGVIGALLIASGVVWTAIKDDYRAFVSGDTGGQNVVVAVEARIEKFAELAGALDETALKDAANRTIRRLSYVDIFGVVLDRVPEFTPHARGALLLDALTRPFLPRVLFPEKSVIDDTRRTIYYTGRLFTITRATSISLGYMTELYIDFGILGPMLVPAAFGFVYGLLYRTLVGWRRTGPLLGGALACAILMPASLLEISIAKLIGALATALLALAPFVVLVVPRWAPWTVARET